MSRYQEVYRMPAMMYAEGSPVLISTGTILKDTVKEQVLVQLKLQNLSDKVLISCKISIKAYEPSGSEIEGINNYAYLDLKENRGGYFGTKTPVYLPNVATRSFQPSVTEAVFSDGTMWSCSDQTLWKPLFLTRAENVFSSQELVEQYKLEAGNGALYYPIIVRGLFLCTCGAVNIHNGDGCYLCNRRYENLIKLLDVEHLLNNRTERIRKEQEAKARKEREEREAAERAAAERAEAIRIREEARRKRNQIIKRVVIIVAPIILLAVITYGSVFHLYPAIQYKKAKEAVGNEQYDVAYDIYIKLGKYKKSPEKALAAIYSKAVTLEEQGLYEEAAIEYERVLGYEDSEEGFSYCKNMVQYSQGMSLFQEKQYEEAIKAFSEIQYFSDSLEWIKRSKYEIGNAYFAEGRYDEAYKFFNEIADKDVKEKGLFLLQKPNLSGIKKGDTFKFGYYEQDNNTTNGKEEIEWIVLKVEDSKALVISKYALDCQPYNTTYSYLNWGKCTLRKWLNDSFLNTAFGSKHQEQISSVSVSADKNPAFSTNPGNATTDKVFLLSIAEAEKYFTTDESRKCAPTAYANAKVPGATSYGVKTASGEATCDWWLRSPGCYEHRAACVSIDGWFDYFGFDVDYDKCCVRPALWINLDP